MASFTLGIFAVFTTKKNQKTLDTICVESRIEEEPMGEPTEPYRLEPVYDLSESQTEIPTPIRGGVGRQAVESRFSDLSLLLACVFGGLTALLLTVELLLAIGTRERSVLLISPTWTLTTFILIGGIVVFGLLAVSSTAWARRKNRP